MKDTRYLCDASWHSFPTPIKETADAIVAIPYTVRDGMGVFPWDEKQADYPTAKHFCGEFCFRQEFVQMLFPEPAPQPEAEIPTAVAV